MISLFNNLRVVFKVGLIALLMGGVMLGLISYMGSRMSAVDESYSDVVKRVDGSTILVSRAARRAEGYRSAAFKLLTETTDEGNAELLKQTSRAAAETLEALNQVRSGLPEKASEVSKMIDTFTTVFAACKPSVEFASTTTTPEENTKAAERLRAECDGFLEKAVQAQAKFVEEMNAFSKAKADEQHANVVAGIRSIMTLSIVAVLAAIGLALVVGICGIARPMGALVGLLQRMSKGETVEMTALGRGDEIGDTARAVDAIKQMLAKQAREEAEAKVKQDQLSVQQRKTDMQKLASDFEGAVGAIIQTVSSAATELEASANNLTATAARTEELSSVVAAASEEASTNVQSVASASEEMASSVNEISRQVQESARIASDAVTQAEKTNGRVVELSQAASKIGDVVELINTIAGQTNLLALNATIEAARAGEAGRGFAVVASEVKSLAEQTAKATGQIADQIKGIQTATSESVEAIREIGVTIGRISEISSTIAAAVEEQGAATQEISRNVQQASIGTTQVASNITDVQRGSSETGSASSQVLSSAQSLAVESNRLKTEVSKFLDTVRAA